jgi:hypothetical protein
MPALGDERLAGIACRSVHLQYPAPKADAFYNELTVEETADGTYFMVAGWGRGYFGIQQLGDGRRLMLFSVWDPAAGDDPNQVPADQRVQLLAKDDAVRVGRFGNEGTGGQSFFDYPWQVGVTYRFLVTARPEGTNRTAYSGYFFEPEARTWKHLVTFSTLTEPDELLQSPYSFVEDFKRDRVSTTHPRRARFGNGWIHTRDGEWQSLEQSRFTADSNPSTNIDAGWIDPQFFLATGGMTENATTQLGQLITGKAQSGPPQDLPITAKP